MTVDEKTFRAALSAVVRGATLLVVLTIVRALAFKLPGLDTRIGPMDAGGYVYVAISAVIVGVLVRMLTPLKTLAAYYLGALAKVGKIPSREKYSPYIVALSGTTVLFIYVIVIYKYLMPVLGTLNEAFLHWGWLYRGVGLAAVVLGVGCLIQMWRQASPLIDLFTGKLTETTADATRKLVHVGCRKCGAQNDRGAKFCVGCGASLAEPAAPPAPAGITCRQCGAENPPTARFCASCGAAAA